LNSRIRLDRNEAEETVPKTLIIIVIFNEGVTSMVFKVEQRVGLRQKDLLETLDLCFLHFIPWTDQLLLKELELQAFPLCEL